jgi:CRAL/TRIO domain
MMLDANYTFYDNGDGGLVEGEIYILDTVGFSFKQLFDVTKNAKTFVTYTTFLQEAAPVRLISNHIANTSTIIDTVMTIVRPILSTEVSELVHFHKAGSDTMFKFIDKDVLPIDYGGTNGTIDDHYRDWLKVFETKRFAERLDCLDIDDFTMLFPSLFAETTCSTMTTGERLQTRLN